MGLFSTLIAILVGLIVLVGYFFPAVPILGLVRTTLLDWAMILVAAAAFVGIFNLLSVHGEKIRARQKGSIYNLILIVFLFGSLALGLGLGPSHPLTVMLFDSVQRPVEASLMAVLAVTLLYASVRLLRQRFNLMSVIFLGTTLLILLGMAPLPFAGSVPLVSDLIRPYIAQVFAAAGARGILLGVALGTLTTSLRILFGADRPYGGK